MNGAPGPSARAGRVSPSPLADATELTGLSCGQVALGEVCDAALRAIEQADPA
jgi:hypothetical protein